MILLSIQKYRILWNRIQRDTEDILTVFRRRDKMNDEVKQLPITELYKMAGTTVVVYSRNFTVTGVLWQPIGDMFHVSGGEDSFSSFRERQITEIWKFAENSLWKISLM